MAYLAVAGLAVAGATAGWLTVVDLQRASLVASAGFGRLPLVTAMAADHRVTVATGATLAAELLAASAFIPWLFVLVRRLARGRPGTFRYRVGWAIGGWFVPILSFVRPKQMVDDAWAASEPGPVPTGSPWYLHAWWATWILSSLLRLVGALFTGDTPSSLVASDRLDAVGGVINIIPAFLAVALVVKLTYRARRLAAGAPPNPAGASPPPAAPGGSPGRRPLSGALSASTLAVAIAVVAAAATAPSSAPAAAGAAVVPGGGSPTAGSTTSPTTTAPGGGGPIHPRNQPWSQLLMSPPPGWRIAGGDLALSVQQLSKQFKDPEAVSTDLILDGYLRGVAREFYLPLPRQVADVELWQFDSAAHAGDFYQEWVDGNEPGPGSIWSSEFPIAALPGSDGYLSNTTDADGFRFAVAVYRVGDMVLHLRLATRGPVPQAVLSSLAADGAQPLRAAPPAAG